MKQFLEGFPEGRIPSEDRDRVSPICFQVSSVQLYRQRHTATDSELEIHLLIFVLRHEMAYEATEIPPLITVEATSVSESGALVTPPSHI
jgi:hypothetical protein